MERRALIVYCDDTPSGKLFGPPVDYINYKNFLTSPLGGAWEEYEIDKIQNPTYDQLIDKMSFLEGADYTFVIFTGHGDIVQCQDLCKQYVELNDQNIWIKKLFSKAPRQTLIIDACRTYRYVEMPMLRQASINTESVENFSLKTKVIYRRIFDNAVLRAPEGITILYATQKGAVADDSRTGAVYLSSLIGGAKNWSKHDHDSCVLPLNEANEYAKKYIEFHYESKQEPTMNLSKRTIFYPFAVKLSSNSITNFLCFG